LCHKTGTLPQVRQCRAGTGDLKKALSNHHPNAMNTFRGLGNFLRFGPNDAFSLSMRHLPWLEYKPRTDHRILNRTSRENTPGLPSWRLTPGCQAGFKPSPLVDGLVRLIEGSQCFPGDEFDVELVLREAPENAVVHSNQPHNSSPRVFTSNVYSINGNPAGSAACAKLFAASSVLSWEESSLPCPVSRRAGNRPFLLLAPSTHVLSLGRRRIL